MASILDSKAEFKKRATELLGQADADRFATQRIDTFGSLAYSVAEQPDKISDERLEKVTAELFGEAATLGTKSAVRRLAFEGLTHSLQDIRLRSEPDTHSTRALPAFEREDLRTTQVARLKGLLIEGDLEPSHGLVDRAASMMRDGVVRYTPPSNCISRDAELSATRRDRDFLAIEGGELAVRRKDTAQSTNISTDFLLQQAFTRRGLALDRVGVLNFDVHERAMRQFFHLCSRPAPVGYERPQTWHIVKADKELWATVARECRTGCKPQASGTRPLDRLVQEATTSHLVTLYLMPVAVRGRPEQRAPPTPSPRPKGTGKARAQTRSRSDRGPPKGKGKSKQKSPAAPRAGGKPSMPRELRHLEPTDAQGRRKCYGFNLDEGCSLPTSGHPPECERGLHQCMACGSPAHGATTCPNGDKSS